MKLRKRGLCDDLFSRLQDDDAKAVKRNSRERERERESEGEREREREREHSEQLGVRLVSKVNDQRVRMQNSDTVASGWQRFALPKCGFPSSLHKLCPPMPAVITYILADGDREAQQWPVFLQMSM
jgi:hypothetical protein